MPYQHICKTVQIRPPRFYKWRDVVRISTNAHEKTGATIEQLMAANALATNGLNFDKQLHYEISNIVEVINWINFIANEAQNLEVALAALITKLSRALHPTLAYFIKRWGIIRLLLAIGFILEALSKFRIKTDALMIYEKRLKIAIIHAENYE